MPEYCIKIEQKTVYEIHLEADDEESAIAKAYEELESGEVTIEDDKVEVEEC